MIRVKIHSAYRRTVAISDSELLGKKFAEGQLQIEVSKDFFDGKEVNEEELTRILKEEQGEDSTFNFVGNKSVAMGIRAGIIGKGKESVIKIQGIPTALSLL